MTKFIKVTTSNGLEVILNTDHIGEINNKYSEIGTCAINMTFGAGYKVRHSLKDIQAKLDITDLTKLELVN